MKKSLSQAIAVATLLGAAATAQASVAVNDKGLGGALLYPLYTVEDGASTLVSVVNTTNQTKVVKVRFVEAMNSAEVLDFHLYMSPQDVWSGAIVPTTNGAKLVSGDTSCIAGYPNGFPAEGLEFRTQQLEADVIAARDRGGFPQQVTGANTSSERVRVGHFEVIEMGEIPAGVKSNFKLSDASYTGYLTAGAPDLRDAVEHVTRDGKRVPNNCAVITKEWSDVQGHWNAVFAGNDDQVSANTSKHAAGYTTVAAPKGGLYGTAAIVNVPNSWASSYDAVALVGTGANVAAPTNGAAAAGGTGGLYAVAQHPRPGSIYPNLATDSRAANVAGALEDASLRDVSKALAVQSVYNDYYVDADFGAETDLVLSFPTKRFYVNDHTGTGLTPLTWAVNGVTGLPVIAANGQIKIATGPDDVAKTAPVNTGYTGALGARPFFYHAWNANTNQACEYLNAPVVYDKEESVEIADDGFISPRPIVANTLPLCYETNVVSVNNSNSFGANLVRTSLKTPFLGGWIDLTAPTAYDNGLPMVGFSNVVTKNGADTVLRNFAQTFKHKTK